MIELIDLIASAKRRARLIADRRRAANGELVVMSGAIRMLAQAENPAWAEQMLGSGSSSGFSVPHPDGSFAACMAQSRAAAQRGEYVKAVVLKPLPNVADEIEVGEMIEMLRNEFLWLQERGFVRLPREHELEPDLPAVDRIRRRALFMELAL